MRKNDQGISSLSFWEHLEELRGRLIKSFIVFILVCFGVYGFSDRILEFLIEPVGHLVFTAPGEAFGTYMTITLWGGFLVSFPFFLYQFWAFVRQALTDSEKKYVYFFGPISFIFFIVGIVFGYFVIIPISLKFLLSFSSATLVPMITVSQYMNFVTTFVLSFGVVFEFPLLLVFLTKIGIATPEFLRQQRRYAVVFIFIVSAILTPPDVCSQCLMAIPLLLLYELGIIFAVMINRFSDAPRNNNLVSQSSNR